MNEEELKILLITYYWPPAGGPAVQRWLHMVEELSLYGSIYVYHPQNAEYPIVDKNLKIQPKKVDNVHLISGPILEFYSFFQAFFPKLKTFRKGQLPSNRERKTSLLSKLLLQIRANFFVPDPKILWRKSSVKILKKLIQENQINTLITTGPPHSMHLIGLELKKIFPTLNLVTDFRDPWVEISYHKHLPLSKKATEKSFARKKSA
ncbi:MAG: hypothetical protein C4K58_06215 [Flavobacteriaceae bacterium]|nr:MAG: hypothetical protein C4K58_06215 [Flavobacteriaceae bacterium]